MSDGNMTTFELAILIRAAEVGSLRAVAALDKYADAVVAEFKPKAEWPDATDDVKPEAAKTLVEPDAVQTEPESFRTTHKLPPYGLEVEVQCGSVWKTAIMFISAEPGKQGTRWIMTSHNREIVPLGNDRWRLIQEPK